MQAAAAVLVLHASIRLQRMHMTAGLQQSMMMTDITHQTCCACVNQSLHACCCRAPEVIDDDRHHPPTGSADVWSLGAVLLQCLTGRAPYEGMSSMAMHGALLQKYAPGPVPDDIPDSLQRLLRQCFHEAAEQRPSLQQIKQVFCLEPRQ